MIQAQEQFDSQVATEQYWLPLIHHENEQGHVVHVECDAYGDTRSPDSYRVHFIEAGYATKLAGTILRAGIFYTPDRRSVREVVVHDADEQQHTLRMNVWDFAVSDEHHGRTESLRPTQSDRLHLGLIVAAKKLDELS